MIGFPECRHTRRKKSGRTKCGTQRFKCLECGKKFTDSTRVLAGMRIGVDRTAQIIAMLCEGLSIRATARLANTDQKTILELLLLVGERCKTYMENANRQPKVPACRSLSGFGTALAVLPNAKLGRTSGESGTRTRPRAAVPCVRL